MKRGYLIAVILYCCALWAYSASSAPLDPLPSPPGADKVKHAIAYAGLAILISKGMSKSERSWKREELFWLPVILAGCYGATDEIHQFFVPVRTCDIFDLMADCTGALLAQVFLLHPRLNRLRRQIH